MARFEKGTTVDNAKYLHLSNNFILYEYVLIRAERDEQGYDTSGRDKRRSGRHRTVLYERIVSIDGSVRRLYKQMSSPTRHAQIHIWKGVDESS